jgi:hypothetical protein
MRWYRARVQAARGAKRELRSHRAPLSTPFVGLVKLAKIRAQRPETPESLLAAPISRSGGAHPGIFRDKKTSPDPTIFLDTEFPENYTFVSCNFTVRSIDV